MAASLARQYSETLGREPRFITGRDTRESGGSIERAFHAGATGEGAICESAEVITTPGVAFLTREFEFDAGIVISASHNPFNDNGIKVFTPSGKKIDEMTERMNEAAVFESAEPVQCAESKPDTSRVDKFHKAYLDHLIKAAGEFSPQD